MGNNINNFQVNNIAIPTSTAMQWAQGVSRQLHTILHHQTKRKMHTRQLCEQLRKLTPGIVWHAEDHACKKIVGYCPRHLEELNHTLYF